MPAHSQLEWLVMDRLQIGAAPSAKILQRPSDLLSEAARPPWLTGGKSHRAVPLACFHSSTLVWNPTAVDTLA